MQEKFKSMLADDTFFTCLLLVLIGVISFGLGRLSVITTPVFTDPPAIVASPEPFILSATAAPVVAGAATSSLATQGFVASRSGSRYHLLTCPGAQQIKEENKIFFTSAAAAEAAGYTKAANCPGL